MEKQEFIKLADECMERVCSWLDSFDPDEIDFATADGVVTIEFPDGVRYVLNRQTAAHQMWLAAGVRAWHYDRNDAGEWRSDKDGHELYERISAVVSEKLGREVRV